MPAAIKYIPPTDTERSSFSVAVQSERNTRSRIYDRAYKYYMGDHDEQLTTDEGQVDDNTSLNIIRLAADRTVSFLFQKLPRFVTDPQRPEKSEAELWFEKTLQANKGLATLHKLAIQGFLAGHTYLRVKPVPANRVGLKEQYPSIEVLPPLSVTVFWNIDEPRDVLWYEYRYVVANNVYIIDYVSEYTPAGRIWHIYKYSGPTLPKDRMLIARILDVPQDDFLTTLAKAGYGDTWKLIEYGVHAYRIPPIIDISHLPHPDSYYGMTEVPNTNLQDTINRIASQINRLSREYSTPTDVLIGADIEEVVDSGDLITIPDPNAKVTRLEMRSDANTLQKVLDERVRALLSLMRVVIITGDVKDLQRVTNASVRTLFLDMLAKNEILKDSYGRALKELALLCFKMSNQSFAVEESNVEVRFIDPLPQDETELANVNLLLHGIKARSLREIVESHGGNWIETRANILEEQEFVKKITPEPVEKNPPGITNIREGNNNDGT